MAILEHIDSFIPHNLLPSNYRIFKDKLDGIKSLSRESLTSDMASTPFEIINYKGRCRLLYYATPKPVKHNIYLVPSLINQYYILDLYPGCSLIEDLIHAGYNVYLLDWQSARPQDRLATLEDHILNWMDWGFHTSKSHSQNKKEWTIFGHCIGGTFATAYQGIKQHKKVSFVNLTAPIDFYDEGIFSLWNRNSTINLSLMAKQWGQIHHEFLLYSFKLINPLSGLRKWKNLWDNSHQQKYVKRFVCLDRWIHDNMPFPGIAYKKFIKDFYQENKLIDDRLYLGDHKVELSKIKSPFLVLTALGDSIVKQKSAKNFQYKIQGKISHKEIEGGHIGCVISARGRRTLIEELNKFTEEHHYG